MRKKIENILKESILVKEKILQGQIPKIEKIAKTIISCLKKGNKLLIFGNGGSAADSQHIAAELVGRFKKERNALPAIALTTDTSILTSLSNDYNFDIVFSRQIEALAKAGDIAWGISTSGNSPNVITAIKKAKTQGLTTIGFTGQKGGKLKDLCDLVLCVSSNNTPRIQETHITVAHIICELVEKVISP